METRLTINKNQIISLIHNLEFNERISVLKNFTEDWVDNILGIHEPESLTQKEYNAKLKDGEEAYKRGEIIKHNDFVKEIEEWKKQKS